MTGHLGEGEPGHNRHQSRQILPGAALALILGVPLAGQDVAPHDEPAAENRVDLPDAPSALISIRLPEGRAVNRLFLAKSPTLDPQRPRGLDHEGGQPGSDAPRVEPPRLKELPRQILRDQKFLWLRPFRLKKSDAPWVATLGGATAALIATDPDVAREISEDPPGSGYAFSHRVSQVGGAAGDLGVASAFYLIGRWRGNERARTTGLLGYRAFADAFIITQALKTVTQRPRPTTAGGTMLIDNAEGDFFEGGRAFPSGHAAGSWALATVVACQYQHKRWMAIVAYSLAGLVSVSRTFEREHFPSDVLVGGALGFMIGRHVCHSQASPNVPAPASRRKSLLNSGPENSEFPARAREPYGGIAPATEPTREPSRMP
ncbi:MAG TPA: phosphatase PAP2 family protein [Terriglobales bacterium]|nr:phosphatase PAP2 family protein [Terriglobales bacterium]